MGVNQTSELYKGFIFDGIDSKGFGVYISGAGVYNAPERDIEEIEIPGRNGAYMLDRGRFHNITVTYPAGLFGTDSDEFAAGIRRLRNALASRRGYCKLIDEYNPLEYRMAVYRGGLEADPAAINGENKAAQFEIQFDCKPQRFRIDGDQPVKMTDGGTIDNPTLFEARPLLQVWGYGGININGEDINLANVYIGKTLISNGSNSPSYNPGYSVANAGDTVTVETAKYTINVTFSSGLTPSGEPYPSTLDTVTWSHGNGTALWNVMGRYIEINATPDTCLYQTASTIYSVTIRGTFKARDTNLVMKTGVYDFTVTGVVDAAGTFTCSHTMTKVSGDTVFANSSRTTRWGNMYVDSTKSALGTPTYIDLDIGESYYYSGNDIISANASLTLPAELPVLKPGANEIQFDNTVTELDIVPRWWEV